MYNIETWKDLLCILQALSPENLNRPIQVCQHHPVHEHVYSLMPAICFGTVDNIGLHYARSSVDNKRHGDDIVIYVDGNPHAEDGAIAYEVEIGDEKTAELFLKKNPIYPKNYCPEEQNWTGPAQKNFDEKGFCLDSKRLNNILIKKRWTDIQELDK